MAIFSEKSADGLWPRLIAQKFIIGWISGKRAQRRIMLSPRILSFVALTAIAVATQLAFKLSQNSNGQYEYNTQSAMTLVELMKLVISCTLLWHSADSMIPERRNSFFSALRSVPQRVYRNYFYLALSYGVYNQLIFTVMESSIDVGTFSLLKSTTPAIVSGLNWFLLGQPLTSQQALCMIIQCLGIIPVVVSPSTSSSNAQQIQLEFQLGDILLMLFCCGMASLSTVFNAVVIQSETQTSIHVQNIILYSFGVVVNLVLYFMIASSQSPFLYGFGQPRVLFLMVLNSFVGLAITMIYKYGDAVLKTLTQPCASSILVFLSYAIFGQSMDVIKAAGAGVVIVDTFLYLKLPNAPPPDLLVKEGSFNRRKGGLIVAMLLCAQLGLSYLSVSTTAQLEKKLLTDGKTIMKDNSDDIRSVLAARTSALVSSADENNDDGTLPIVLVIQALRLDDPSGTNNKTEKMMMIAENEAKVNLLELYRPSFVDMYYDSPQYVGHHDVKVACDEVAFRDIRSKCYSCVDQEIMLPGRPDEHRFACAAELFSLVESRKISSSDSNKTTTKGYLVIHADFYLAPGFVQQAREAVLQHPSSVWTAGGPSWGHSNATTTWAPLTPSQYSSLPAPRSTIWMWWEEYAPKLDAARAYIAQKFPSFVLNPGDKLAPMAGHNHNTWVDMYYVPTVISEQFALLAKLMKQFHIMNEIAVVESLLLAGMHGRVDGEYTFPCYGNCCTQVDAVQLMNASFLERYPCGHKLALQDSESRSALASAWAEALIDETIPS
jgi:solute carrier family 35 (probable UDP-sugar transporter), member A4